jgi:hypothetical protein
MTKTVTKAPAIKLELIEEAKLGAAIEANQKAHKKVDMQWQVLACSAIAAFAAHGNVFYINKVYSSMGKGARHTAMTQFMLAFGGVKANVGENKAVTPFVKDADKKVNMADAMSTMWFDMAPSPKPDEVLDYLALILKVAKKSPKEGQDVKHDKFREAVMALAAEFEGQEDSEGGTTDAAKNSGAETTAPV